MAITQGTPEYFSERKKSPACGSDLAAMIGVNPYKTPLQEREDSILVNSQYFPLDPNGSCQTYIGDLQNQLCNGFLVNPNSVYINSTSTQEEIRNFGYLVRLAINIRPVESCKNSSDTYKFLCSYLFPECAEYTDPITKKTYAYPLLPCNDNCVSMTKTCQISSSRINCNMKETVIVDGTNVSFPYFPKNSTSYGINAPTFSDSCINTTNIVSQNTTIQKCYPPLVYHVTKDQVYDESIGYIFPSPNSSCVVNCPAPLYYPNQWRNLFKLSDVLSILSCILTLFLVITLGVINPKLSRFDKINVALLTSIFCQSFSGALLTFNGTEKTLCPEPGRFASHIDGVCVASAFILHGTSLLVVQWWCIMSFEIWFTIFQVGRKQKDRFIYYLISTIIIAWIPPIVAISNSQYTGGPQMPFCWMNNFNYQRFSFWLPLGIFLCGGGIFLILLIREIYIIISSATDSKKKSRVKLLKMELKPMISLVMYFSILLYLFIYDQWVNNHKHIYTDSIPDYGLCIAQSQDPSKCLLKAPDIAGFGYFIYSIRVFGIYAFLIYGLSSRTFKIWQANYLFIKIGKRIEQFTGITTTTMGSSTSNGNSSATSNANSKAASAIETPDDIDGQDSVELESDE
ncbi:hypothetical protein DICPUDRAFT_85139 [Dictyostelium purpureum]|uniref:G-protein coupled receptors family 2 profile 2 domain-containing protein n=1 Tax=Dictyostelium purpureum TaxID=5786 RepID=F1A4U2_DICPU|nr:uncharacterized protein DICPUDRAFT_85139 [Dictyostelium purpureum]EGC28790.1 hypothetical protein DICPUDRAFT_85139 [Dictyostelium purpureum]|eukprot:XP_003294685.1 hypothetical protein DICPUDRAFT_85139 [Dictyostelium purpureum]